MEKVRAVFRNGSKLNLARKKGCQMFFRKISKTYLFKIILRRTEFFTSKPNKILFNVGNCYINIEYVFTLIPKFVSISNYKR